MDKSRTNKNLKLKNFYPFIISIIITLIISITFIRGKQYISINRLELVLEILIPSIISFLGFIIAAMTVMLGLNKNHILKKLTENKSYKFHIMQYYIEPILAGLGLIFTSFIVLIKTAEDCNVYSLYFIFLLFFIIYLVITFLRLSLVLLSFFDSDDSGGTGTSDEEIIDSHGKSSF